MIARYTAHGMAVPDSEGELVSYGAFRKLQEEVERLQIIVDKNAKTADLMDRTLEALEKQLNEPLKAAKAVKEE